VNIYKKRAAISRNTEKRKQNDKDNKRKWHIFALTGTVDFAVILPSKLCLLKGPKCEIFDSGFFALIRPIWIGDLGTRAKNYTF
jgi:hypothetical protein